MSRRDLDVLVVGGGAIGAALALGLAREGFDVALVEAGAPKPWSAADDVDLRVVALAADAKSLLSHLDVWTAIASSRIGPFRRMRVWDAVAPGELAFDAADDGEAALGWIVENRLIQHALWQAIASEGRVRLVCPAEVADVANEDSAAVATLADGARLSARVLVAADGAASPLRARLGIGCDERDYAQRAVVAHVATARPHEDTAWQRFLPGGPLAFLPLADGRSSIVWSLPSEDAARVLALDDEAFRRELGAAFDFRLGTIESSTARAAFPLRLRLAQRYLAGRSVLAGDAAHVVHPLAGQGMNLGFRDVACLVRVLADARRRGADIGAAHALRRYERERRSDNAIAARAFDGIQRAFGGDDPLRRTLRTVAFAAAERLGPVRQALASAAAGRLS